MTAALLVTGATGFVGSALVRRRLGDGSQGSNLHVFVRDPARCGFDPSAVRVLRGDLDNEAEVEAAIQTFAEHSRERGVPAHVVHAAALISYRRADAEASRIANVRGTRFVVEACVRHGVQRVVHVSSVVAVGHAPCVESALDEDAPFNGAELRCDYVTTKRAAEDYALAAAPELEVVVVNPGAIFGPSHRPTNTLRFLETVQRGYPGPCAPPGSLSVVGVGDVARGIELALERGRDRRRYLLTESNWTLLELLREVARHYGVPIGVRWPLPRALWSLVVAAAAAHERVRPPLAATSQALALLGRHFRFDSTRARLELGWEPRPFAEVLAGIPRPVSSRSSRAGVSAGGPSGEIVG